MSIKLNLHTHSAGSYDCTTTIEEFASCFESGMVDQIAITDHNEIRYAQDAQRSLGSDRVIVGEEVSIAGGKHLIGLFLQKFVPAGLSLTRTAELIRAQGGLVYVPHPFSPDWGIGAAGLDGLLQTKLVDIVEGFNSWNYFTVVNLRGRKSQNQQAWEYAVKNNLQVSSASDSHTADTLGNAYTVISETATKQNLLLQLSKPTVVHKSSYNSLSISMIKPAWKYIIRKFRR